MEYKAFILYVKIYQNPVIVQDFLRLTGLTALQDFFLQLSPAIEFTGFFGFFCVLKSKHNTTFYRNTIKIYCKTILNVL